MHKPKVIGRVTLAPPIACNVLACDCLEPRKPALKARR
jgi:hypothetical protein